MAITRSQIARQLMAEGGVSLDDAKMMAPKGEFLAYINPKEAQMLKDAGGSGIMTPMGIPSFIDFGDYDAVAGAAAGGEFGGGSPEDTFGGGDNAPDAVTGGAPPPKTPVRDRVISGLDTIARFTIPAYGAVRGAMDISNFISRNKQPKVTNIVDEVALTKGRTPTVIPEGDSDTQIAQPIMPMMPLVPKLPSDIEPKQSDMEFVQRFTLPERFRLANGGDVSVRDAERMALPGESLAYINDDEAALLKSLGGAGKAINETGIPSFFVKKLFKKATKAVKKVVKSPIGKAALAGAAIYGLGGGSFFGRTLPTFGSLPLQSSAAGPGGFGFGNILTNVGRLTGLGSGGLDLGTKFSGLTKGQKALAGIAGASVLGGLAAGGEEEDIDSLAGRISDQTGLDLQAIRKEVQDAYAAGDISGLRSKYPFLVPTGSAMAEGGIARLGYQEGSPPTFAEGVKQKFVSDEAGAIPKKMKDGEGGVLPSDMGKLKRKDFESEEDYKRYLRQLNKKAEGGLMNLGGTEMDLRGGGFVPIGAKEKADDVPARLSKNEFVFTADAVRAAGGGSVEKGAQKMYNTMKQLEDSIA